MSKTTSQTLVAGLMRAGAGSRVRDKFAEAEMVSADDFLPARGPASSHRVPDAVHVSATSSATSYAPGVEARLGGRFLVPLSLIKDNPNNPREFYLLEHVKALAASINKDGQMQAALAYAPSATEPCFTLKEGHSRKKAMHSLGLKHMVLEVVAPPASDMEDYRQARELNKQRNEISVFDDAARFIRLLETKVAETQGELAASLGESPEYVSKVLGIGRLPPGVLKRMAESIDYRFGMTMAHYVRMFHEIKGEVATDKLVTRILEQKLSVRQVEQLLTSQRRPDSEPRAPQQRMRPLNRAECSGVGRGELKFFPDGRFELELAAVDEGARKSLFNKLVAALREAGVEVDSGVDA